MVEGIIVGVAAIVVILWKTIAGFLDGRREEAKRRIAAGEDWPPMIDGVKPSAPPDFKLPKPVNVPRPPSDSDLEIALRIQRQIETTTSTPNMGSAGINSFDVTGVPVYYNGETRYMSIQEARARGLLLENPPPPPTAGLPVMVSLPELVRQGIISANEAREKLGLPIDSQFEEVEGVVTASDSGGTVIEYRRKGQKKESFEKPKRAIEVE